MAHAMCLSRGSPIARCARRSIPANAHAGADTITFSLGGTITLGSTLPAVSDDLTIDGGAQPVTVSGNDSVRVLQANAGTTLNLNALTIAHGKCDNCDGGGVLSAGTLNVTNSTFANNSAPNTTGRGGAIATDISATLTVSNSTFDHNSGSIGGAIFSGFDSGLTVINSTFSLNDATSGVGPGSIHVANGVAVLKNTILVHGAGQNCSTILGSFSADSHNVADDATCDSAARATRAQIDLAALNNYGGPTQTTPPQSGSVVINAGDDTVCAAAPVNNRDQRGVTRLIGEHCESGADENGDTPQSGPTFTVNDTADTDDGSCDVTASCTLREAINAANAQGGANTIVFSVGGTITLGSTLPAISDDLTIDGSAHAVTVSGNNSVRVLQVNASKTLNLNALTIAKGSSPNGGGIANSGTLNVTNCTFSGNNAAGSNGGALYGGSGALTVTNSTFSGNGAAQGGGIYNDGGTVNVTNSTFSGNGGTTNGSGVFNNGGSATLRNPIISDSSSGGDCSAFRRHARCRRP